MKRCPTDCGVSLHSVTKLTSPTAACLFLSGSANASARSCLSRNARSERLRSTTLVRANTIFLLLIVELVTEEKPARPEQSDRNSYSTAPDV